MHVIVCDELPEKIRFPVYDERNAKNNRVVEVRNQTHGSLSCLLQVFWRYIRYVLRKILISVVFESKYEREAIVWFLSVSYTVV
ncbi:Uncharacterised protein [Yersinia enterocolitica]|uniref:Transposase n=1 Tax=Yersinia enterocolitica TaxID=630 RepID=A0ABP1YGF3_YEREN|nr:Uncharacterised protein [Yersinia enterocolitica]CNG61354.1 Uncharacterised protein [Yersinia enterocolitica]